MIFVVGNSRSGTTMMGRILGNHPDVFMFRELHFFEELWAPQSAPVTLSTEEATDIAARLLSIQREGYMAKRNPRDWQDEAGEFVSKLAEPVRATDVFSAFLDHETRREGASVPCEQTPRNVFYLDQIAAAWPEAVVIEMVRDPRDVMLSKKYKWKRSYLGNSRFPLKAALLAWANYHPLLTSRLWVSAVRAGAQVPDGLRVIQVRYEDFVASPAETLEQICNLAGLEYSAAMLDVPRVGSSVKADSGQRGISKESTGRWRSGGLNAAELSICQEVAGDEMTALGYELADVRYSALSRLGYHLLLPVKLFAALLMNLRRLRSVSQAIKRRMN